MKVLLKKARKSALKPKNGGKFAIAIAIGLLGLASCSTEEDPGTPVPLPYASITRISDIGPEFVWTYTVANDQLSAIQWEDLQGATETTITDITYDGTLLSKIVADEGNGNMRTLSITYDAAGNFDKSTDERSSNPGQVWHMQAEYENGKIAQLNRHRTTNGVINSASSSEMTYDAAGNVSQMTQTSGALVTDVTVTYDNNPNKAYLQPELLVILFTGFSHTSPMIWVETDPQLVVLSKNHPVEIVRQNSNQHLKVTMDYTFDAEGYIAQVVTKWFDLLQGGTQTLERTYAVTRP